MTAIKIISVLGLPVQLLLIIQCAISGKPPLFQQQPFTAYEESMCNFKQLFHHQSFDAQSEVEQAIIT